VASKASEVVALKTGLKVLALNDVGAIENYFDGADEIDPAFAMIKGGGLH
jgi:ribose 5-phosphate isomerase A